VERTGDPGNCGRSIAIEQFADDRTDALFAVRRPGNLSILGDQLDIVAAAARWPTGEYDERLLLDFGSPSARIEGQVDDIANRFTDPSLATNQCIGRCYYIKALRSRRGVGSALRVDFDSLFDRDMNNDRRIHAEVSYVGILQWVARFTGLRESWNYSNLGEKQTKGKHQQGAHDFL